MFQERIISIVILLCFPIFIGAQSVNISVIDPETGIINIKDQIEGLKNVESYSRFTLIDEKNNDYIFKGISVSNVTTDLYKVKIADGNIESQISHPSLPGFFDLLFGLQQDNSSDSLFAIYHNEEANEYSLVDVNIEEGSFNIINSLAGIKLIHTDKVFFNQSKRELIFFGIDELLQKKFFRVDIKSGELLLSESFALNLIQLEMNPQTGLLYGFNWNEEKELYDFVSVDYSNGEMEILSTIQELNSIVISPRLYTLDHKNARYIFKGNNFEDEEILFSLGLENGEVLSSPLFYTLGNGFTYFAELEFNNENETLYAFFIDQNQTSTAVKDHTSISSPQVYPNPFQESTTINLNDFYEDLTMTLYSPDGKRIQTRALGKTSKFTIKRESLENGIYFMSLKAKDLSLVLKLIVD